MDTLYVGLGNPIPAYDGTRHNIGAKLLMDLAEISFSKGKKSKEVQTKFKSFYVERKTGDRVNHFLFPQTFMNVSGIAVKEAMKKLKIPPEQIVVLHDEIDLPPREVRYKFGGGHRGHNGLRSIIGETGSADFHRLRIGVGRPDHPGFSVADYVLSRYPLEDEPSLDTLRDLLAQNNLNF